MPKRKLSLTPVRRQPRRAAKKHRMQTPPCNIEASSRSPRVTPAIQNPMISPGEEGGGSDYFFTDPESTPLPELSCPPFASPVKTPKPVLPPLKAKPADNIKMTQRTERDEFISYRMNGKLIPDREDTPGSSNDIGEDYDSFASRDSPVIKMEETEYSTVELNREFKEMKRFYSSSPIDTHSRVFDTKGTLVHQSHSQPSPIITPAIKHTTQGTAVTTSTITRDITYPEGGKLHYYHTEDGSLFPSLRQTRRNPHVTDEEYEIATTVKIKNEAERIIPYDFEVPYGYDGFVKISTSPLEGTEVIETVNWIPAMRSQDLRDSLRRQFEKSIDDKTTILQEEPTSSMKEKEISVQVPLKPVNEQIIKFYPSGELNLYLQKLAEHKGESPLTFTDINDFPGLTEAHVSLVNADYLFHQTHADLPDSEIVAYGYPGLTQWRWTGPKVYELIDWSLPRTARLAKRRQVIDALQRAGKLFMTARKARGVTERQAELADRVLRCWELFGGVPEPGEVPYGYAGFVNDCVGEEPFVLDWDPVGFSWEYAVDEGEMRRLVRMAREEEEGEEVGVDEEKAKDEYGDEDDDDGDDDAEKYESEDEDDEAGSSWWRGGLMGKDLERAKREGYIPWRNQVWENDWDGDVRDLDWDHLRGFRVRPKIVRFNQPLVRKDGENIKQEIPEKVVEMWD